MKHMAAEGSTPHHPREADRQRRAAAIRTGDRAVIARAITAIENDLPSAEALLEALAPDAGHAHVVGITGPPGAGKSTLISAMLREYTARGQRIAVVAVDPSSPLTGGAVLGDRIRMTQSGAAENVFIRSVAARGHSGGLSRTTRRIVDLLDAAGFGVVVVETVGTGQSEVAIAALADTSIVVCPPGQGDDVQAIKAGVLEIADILVVSKGDLALASRTVRNLEEMVRDRRQREGWQAPVLVVTAPDGKGIAALIDKAAEHALALGHGRRLGNRSAAIGAVVAGSENVQHATEEVDVRAQMLALAAHDPFPRHCALRVIDAGLGSATVAMTVAAEHLNFNGTCHGGAIFTLADTAFGLASNSHGVVAAGIDAHVTYHRAVHSGDVLIAKASEVSRNARIAVYRVDVTGPGERAVASFTGTVYVTGRMHHDPGHRAPKA